MGPVGSKWQFQISGKKGRVIVVVQTRVERPIDGPTGATLRYATQCPVTVEVFDVKTRQQFESDGNALRPLR